MESLVVGDWNLIAQNNSFHYSRQLSTLNRSWKSEHLGSYVCRLLMGNYNRLRVTGFVQIESIHWYWLYCLYLFCFGDSTPFSLSYLMMNHNDPKLSYRHLFDLWRFVRSYCTTSSNILHLYQSTRPLQDSFLDPLWGLPLDPPMDLPLSGLRPFQGTHHQLPTRRPRGLVSQNPINL